MREVGTDVLNNRVEIKNLNSFRAMERGIAYEIERQIKIMESGGTVAQETLGWDEANGCTYTQRSKEDAHDYRYFPEPDLPPACGGPGLGAPSALHIARTAARPGAALSGGFRPDYG